MFAYGVTNSGKSCVLSLPPSPRYSSRHSRTEGRCADDYLPLISSCIVRYTIQGGADADGSGSERGVIPRTIDVVFNSVEDRQTDLNVSNSVHDHLIRSSAKLTTFPAICDLRSDPPSFLPSRSSMRPRKGTLVDHRSNRMPRRACQKSETLLVSLS